MKKLHLFIVPVLLPLLLLCLLPALAQAEDNNRLSVERLWQMQRIGSPVASVDGKYIVAPVTNYDVKTDKATTRLWLFSADGKQQRPLTIDGQRASEPVFSPDGKTLAFISQRDKDDTGQIYLLAMNVPGEAQRLTEVPTGVSGLKWRGKHLYFISRVWPDKNWQEMSEKLKADKDKKVSAMQWNAVP
jgi:dipeptidyl aminopeptidase/acylaminoacyl peptidase